MINPTPKILLVTILLLVTGLLQTSDANDNEKEPSAEPYSFSYNAESTGGYSSHQESGDASGRVQGFYIIMGDDNRERRVDYVADENGYRATISTNEVGTRSESSADAQYSARLPSKEQLDQAKVTVEEYKYLEDQHAAERERHLNQYNQQVQIQQQQQVQQQQQQQPQSLTQNSQRWSSGSGASNNQQQSSQQSSSSQSATQRWTPSAQQPINSRQQQQQYEQASNLTTTSTTDNLDDEGWRRSAKLLAVNGNNNNNQQQEVTNQGASISTGSNQNSFLAKMNNLQQQKRFTTSNTNINERERPVNAAVSSSSSSSSTTTTGGRVAFGLDANSAPQSQELRTQQAQRQTTNTWQPSVQTAPQLVRMGPTGPNLQRQFEQQQFMQQASQLAAQDYPRQSSQLNANVNSQEERLQQLRQQTGASVVSSREQQQQEQRQPAVVDESVSLDRNNVALQLPQWQANINAASTQSGPASQEYSQINQQQNNIIDEVSGEQQVDNQQQTSIGGDYVRDQLNQSYAIESSSGDNNQPEPIKTTQLIIPMQQQQQQQAMQQSYQPYETTTTSQPRAPSGFLAINLSQQEIVGDSKPVTPVNNYEAPEQIGNQRAVEKIVTQQQQNQKTGGDYQQISIKQQQQPQRPQSIQQIIQNVPRQQQQQAVKQQQKVVVTPVYMTTVSPAQPEYTTTRQVSEATTTTPQPIVEIARTSFEVPARTTTTTTTTTPVTTTTTTKGQVVVQEQQQQQYDTTTTSIPSRVSYTPSTVLSSGGFTTSFEKITRRPVAVKQQQQFIGGTKGGSQGAKRVALGVKYTTTTTAPISSRPIEQNLARETPGANLISTTTTTTTTTDLPREQYTTTTIAAPRPSYMQTLITSERPEFVDRQTKQQQQQVAVEAQKAPQAPNQQQKSYSNYNGPIATSNEYSTTARPFRSEINSPKSKPNQQQQQARTQQQQQQWKGGVKGGAGKSVGKRQFWQQQQPTVTSGSQKQAPELVLSQKSQASVDYATSTEYGSRIQGRVPK